VELLARRRRRREGLVDLARDPLLPYAVERVDELLLAREVVVDRPGGDAGALGDRGHCGAVVPALDEQRQGRR
jgi:hypothetical protein